MANEPGGGTPGVRSGGAVPPGPAGTSTGSASTRTDNTVPSGGGGTETTQASPRAGPGDLRDGLFGDTREPRTYAEGKFQNVDDLEKSYLSLDKLYNGKLDKLIDEMPDEVFRQKGIARGLFQSVPETYENIPQMLSDAGLEVFEEGHEAHAQFEATLREGEFRQKQLGLMMGMLKNYNEQVKAQIGILPDRHLREAELIKVWGHETKARTAEVGKWAMANLDPAYYRAPLMRTPQGMQALYGWMMSRRDQAPITSDRPADQSWSQGGIDQEIDRIMARKPFKDGPMNPGYKQAERQVYDLLQRQERLKNRS